MLHTFVLLKTEKKAFLEGLSIIGIRLACIVHYNLGNQQKLYILIKKMYTVAAIESCA